MWVPVSQLLADGRQLSVAYHEQGYFLGDGLFDNVTPEMNICKEEIFSPLHMHGSDGVRFYTKRKAITDRWPKPSESKEEFVIPTMK